jgi:predicted phosphodiesterase
MRLAIMSDVHSNSVALNTVLDHAYGKGRCESVLFLGDLLSYGPDPISVLDTAQSEFTWTVMGNHETLFFELTHLLEHEANEVIATYNENRKTINEILEEAQQACENPYTSKYVAAMHNIGGIAQFIEERHKNLSVTNSHAIDSILRNIVQLRVAKYEYGQILSQERDSEGFGPKEVELDGVKLVLVHGTLNNPKDENLYPWQCLGGDTFFLRHAQLSKAYDKYGDERLCVFSGHTHIPLYLRIDDSAQRGSQDFGKNDLDYGKPLQLGKWVTLINPGSVGKPRDWDPRAAYAIMDTDLKTVEYFRIPYDIQKTSRHMQTQYYHSELIAQLRKANTPNNLPDVAYDLLSKRKKAV